VLPDSLKPRLPASIPLVLVGLLVAALLLGGGTRQGVASDHILQWLALPALLFGCWLLLTRPRRSRWGWPLALLAGALALPLLQLVPLPPALWTRLPDRELVLEGFVAAGVPPPWMPLSMAPEATLRAWLFLMAPAAVFLLGLQLDLRGRRLASLVVIVFAVLAVCVGLAQLMGGPQSPLYLHEITNRNSSVGFFANRNHHAALLYAVLPLAAAWAIGMVRDHRPGMPVAVALMLLVGVVLILGLGMTLSRSGLALAMLATAGVLAMALVGARGAQRARSTRVVLVMAVVGIVTVVQFGLWGIASRLDRDPFEDYRFTIAAQVVEVAGRHAPVGAGVGAFVPVYASHEDRALMLRAWVNRAHNDWLELWLEAGVAGVGLALGMLAWWLVAGLRAWRRGPGGRADPAGALDRALAQAASLAGLLLLLHSLTDYPLRTAALACLFAWFAALMLPPARQRFT